MNDSDFDLPDGLTLRAARLDDRVPLISLLSSVVPHCSEQTVWDVPWSWPEYWVMQTAEGTLAAAGSLKRLDAQRCELRGLVVHADWRGRGLAGAIVRHLLSVAARADYDTVCVTRQPEFFRRFGFSDTHPFWLDLEPSRHPRDKGSPRRVPMLAQRPSQRGNP
jgi:N-acetylglutamate synthase-like GNAT family acetyltransferase